jgi:hypothetical protein
MHILDNLEVDIPRPSHATYLDDSNIGNKKGLRETREETFYAIKRLTHAGLPLNIWKCRMLVYSSHLLGLLLWDSNVTLGVKAMQRFMGMELPRNLRDI